MTMMYEMMRRYGAFITSSSALIAYAQTDATSMTKLTAPPMRTAVSSFADTPKNGQMPRKYASTKLLIRAALMNIDQFDASLMKWPPAAAFRPALPAPSVG